MNWLKVYEKIIENRRMNIPEKFEIHHIIPKSIFNTSYARQKINFIKIENIDDEQNLVKLTLREHIFCHAILCKILKENKNCYIKMIYAFNFMNNRSKNFNSAIYSNLKLEYSKALSERLKGKPSQAKGCKWSEEAKKRKSENIKGKAYEELYGKETATRLKEKRREHLKNRKITEETKKKLSEREVTPEWKEKISLANKGKKRSIEQKEKIRSFMGNSFLNLHIDQTFYILINKETNEEYILRKHDVGTLNLRMNFLRLIRNMNNFSSRSKWACIGIKEFKDEEEKELFIKNNKKINLIDEYTFYKQYKEKREVKDERSSNNNKRVL